MVATLSAFLVLSVAVVLAYPLLRRAGARGFYVLAVLTGCSAACFVPLMPAALVGEVVTWEAAWIPQYNLNLSFYIDLFALCLALLVTCAGALILAYCARYFRADDANVARFGTVFVSFSAAMLGLVLADNVFVLFGFWEATTVLSFLLIAHNGMKLTSRAAAQQAIIVTTLGGLAMFVGLLLLVSIAGSANLSEILAQQPEGVVVTVAVYLLLAGALSKSAIIPFQFWLPQAMAAPTPVSAYLHAAAMVKAGIYLLARLGPCFGDMPGYTQTLVVLGGATMLLGAFRALKQYDLKLILAYGTVSQLGMLTMLFGLANPATDAAAAALLFAHALAKAPLFLSVGMIEHRTGTRDMRRISGLGRLTPQLADVTTVAALSLIGIPPLFGFVAKEAALAELYAGGHSPLFTAALVILVLGSMLTTAYMLRFLLGAFAQKPGIADCVTLSAQLPGMLIAPAIFVLLAIAAGVGAAWLDPVYQAIRPGDTQPEHLALWHGFTPALLTTGVVLCGGLLILLASLKLRLNRFEVPERYTASSLYFKLLRGLDHFAVRLTALTQRGSLPFYIAVILVVAIFATCSTLFVPGLSLPATNITPGSVAQILIAGGLIIAAIATGLARKRFQAVILVGLTGFGMSTLFGISGAPDLALTQMLVEAITLIACVLVIRRLPREIKVKQSRLARFVHVVIASAAALAIGVVTVHAIAARNSEAISGAFADLAVTGGHGYNIVNVTLVDIRGWDTFGELSVVVAAATGVASLVFLSARVDNLPKISRRDAKQHVLHRLRRVADPADPVTRNSWLISGSNLSPERRSIVLEVVVRLTFHALLVFSIYLLLAGHNSPGGGFAGGLVAGMALVARYLAGGRDELGASVPFDAGKIVGAGLALAALTAAAPLLFGKQALYSSWIDLDLGLLGEISLVSSTLFDVGVYLVVFGLVLDVLRSLGAQIDVNSESGARVARA